MLGFEQGMLSSKLGSGRVVGQFYQFLFIYFA